ncbi:MAG: hypothetical protein H8D96_21175 [Desulfobacterales bacterium]|uniref:Polysaccharide chain length determinant N-terminal domain-containing protein n=1 Tax=Candidatus Desulfatibia vada TaxID=2841696 RepID=A0A8J6NXC6_9BACT|nr:hypothetical protein [Candidatus Desulfatibia vada]
MTDQPQQHEPAHHRVEMHPDDEIELMDYLLVIWKWKWRIILITFVCMVAAGVVSFNMPRIHEVSMIIEPAVIGMQENGNPLFLDLVNMKGKIENGLYNTRILNRLNINPRLTQLGFKVVNPKNTKLIKISSEWEQDKISTGTKILAQLAAEMAYDAEKALQSKKEDLDMQITVKQNEIATIETQRKDIGKQIATKLNEIAKIETQRKDLDKQILLKLSDIQGKKNQIKLQQAILKNIGERKTELIQEVKQVKNNTERLIQQKNRVVEGKSSEENVSLLLYFTTVQQNVAYFNQLNDRLNNLKSNEDRIGAEIEKLEKDINDINTAIERLKIQKTEGLKANANDINTEIERLKIQKTEGLQANVNDIKIEIERLNIKKSYIENIKVLKEPESSEFPIKPKKKRNVVLAGAVGFMLAVFMAFFVEYLQKAREESMIKKGLK